MTMLRENIVSTEMRDADRYAQSFLDAGMIEARDFETVKEIAKVSFDPAYYNLTPKEMTEIDVTAYVRRMRGYWQRQIDMLLKILEPLTPISPQIAPLVQPISSMLPEQGPRRIQFILGKPTGLEQEAPDGIPLEPTDTPTEEQMNWLEHERYSAATNADLIKDLLRTLELIKTDDFEATRVHFSFVLDNNAWRPTFTVYSPSFSDESYWPPKSSVLDTINAMTGFVGERAFVRWCACGV
jgi:hypothetical protein